MVIDDMSKKNFDRTAKLKRKREKRKHRKVVTLAIITIFGIQMH